MKKRPFSLKFIYFHRSAQIVLMMKSPKKRASLLSFSRHCSTLWCLWWRSPTSEKYIFDVREREKNDYLVRIKSWNLFITHRAIINCFEISMLRQPDGVYQTRARIFFYFFSKMKICLPWAGTEMGWKEEKLQQFFNLSIVKSRSTEFGGSFHRHTLDFPAKSKIECLQGNHDSTPAVASSHTRHEIKRSFSVWIWDDFRSCLVVNWRECARWEIDIWYVNQLSSIAHRGSSGFGNENFAVLFCLRWIYNFHFIMKHSLSDCMFFNLSITSTRADAPCTIIFFISALSTWKFSLKTTHINFRMHGKILDFFMRHTTLSECIRDVKIYANRNNPFKLLSPLRTRLLISALSWHVYHEGEGKSVKILKDEMSWKSSEDGEKERNHPKELARNWRTQTSILCL